MGCSVSKCDINIQMSPIAEDKDTLDAMKCLINQQNSPKIAEIISEALTKIKRIQQLNKDSTSVNHYQSRPTANCPGISTLISSQERQSPVLEQETGTIKAIIHQNMEDSQDDRSSEMSMTPAVLDMMSDSDSDDDLPDEHLEGSSHRYRVDSGDGYEVKGIQKGQQKLTIKGLKNPANNQHQVIKATQEFHNYSLNQYQQRLAKLSNQMSRKKIYIKGKDPVSDLNEKSSVANPEGNLSPLCNLEAQKSTKSSAFAIRKVKNDPNSKKPPIYEQNNFKSELSTMRFPRRAYIVKERLSEKNIPPFKANSIRPIDFSKYSSVRKSSSTIRINVKSSLRMSEVRENKLEGSLRCMNSSYGLAVIEQSLNDSELFRSKSSASSIPEHTYE
jgi:hypothetical protein